MHLWKFQDEHNWMAVWTPASYGRMAATVINGAAFVYENGELKNAAAYTPAAQVK